MGAHQGGDGLRGTVHPQPHEFGGHGPDVRVRVVVQELDRARLEHGTVGAAGGRVRLAAVAGQRVERRHPVVLRWHTQLGAVPIPKSSDPERQRANLDVFGFELDQAQLRAVGERAHRRVGGDPEVHEEF